VEPHAGPVPRRAVLRVLQGHPALEHLMSLTDSDRGILSHYDRKRPGVRATMTAVHVVLLVGLVVAGLGPVLWLAKAAVTTTQDSISAPLQLWPSGIDWANLQAAWVEVDVSRYFLNTLVVAAGCWIASLVVATTGGYALSVLRPKY